MTTHRYLWAATALIIALLSSCSDKKSYAELLTEEDQAVNYFLSDQRVDDQFPTDGTFLYGDDAPFYKMDTEGNVYMQVLSPGSASRPDTDNRVYFRFTRYNLLRYQTGSELAGSGNSESLAGDGALYFLFNNNTLQLSAQYGTGLQVPIHYLGSDAHVRLIVKSQFGRPSEMANVIPFLYDIRYYESPMFPWTDTEADE